MWFFLLFGSPLGALSLLNGFTPAAPAAAPRPGEGG